MEETEDSTRGQRSKKCDISNCPDMGRVLARMGKTEIAYCPKHRKLYGERIVNALINSVFNYRLTNFLSSVKVRIFLSDDFLCPICATKMKTFIIEKTEELEKLEDYHEENEIKEGLDELK